MRDYVSGTFGSPVNAVSTLDHHIRASGSSSDIRLVNVDVRLQAPDGVLDVLGEMLRAVPHSPFGNVPDLTVSVEERGDVWEIRGFAGSLKVLGRSAIPHVAGALVTSAVQGAAAAHRVGALRATVMENGGRALAMIGDDWESTITIAAHLHDRGWSYVGSNHAFLDSATLEVFAVQKSLYVNASSVHHFPMSYRRAIEASPWYVTPRGISFYAVDPRKVDRERTWTPVARLIGALVIDGSMAERPALESLDPLVLRGDRFSSLAIDWRRVAAAEMQLGRFVESCDLVDYWFDSIRSSSTC